MVQAKLDGLTALREQVLYNLQEIDAPINSEEPVDELMDEPVDEQSNSDDDQT